MVGFLTRALLPQVKTRPRGGSSPRTGRCVVARALCEARTFLSCTALHDLQLSTAVCKSVGEVLRLAENGDMTSCCFDNADKFESYLDGADHER
jgi:hypothetical protein